MTEGRFMFQLSACDHTAEQQAQMVQALKKCAELVSRKSCPKLWQLTDCLNRREKAPSAALAKRKKRMLFWGLLNWFLGMFALIPGLTAPTELWMVLIMGAICLGVGSGRLWHDYRGTLAAVSLPAGALLCFGAIGAWEELGCLLVLGVGELVVAAAALVTRKRQRAQPQKRRKARWEEQMAQTMLCTRQELPENTKMFAVFTEESMALCQSEIEEEETFPYEQFLCMLETRNLLLAVVGEKGLLLQKSELTQGTFDEFRAFLKERVPWVLVEEPSKQTTAVL